MKQAEEIIQKITDDTSPVKISKIKVSFGWKNHPLCDIM